MFNFQPASVSTQRTQRKRKVPSYVKLPNTWTHLFLCVAKTTESESPSPNYKQQLNQAGIGEKKLVFEKNTLCPYFHDKLLEAFPNILQGGGYELLRTKYRSISKLEILQPKSRSGHNVSDLKEMIASAKVYIRPIQRDLSLEPAVQLQFETSVSLLRNLWLI